MTTTHDHVSTIRAQVKPAASEPDIPFSAEAGISELVGPEESGGAFSLYRWTLGVQSRGPSPHLHRTFDEWFLVESGQLVFDDGVERRQLHPGDSAHAPAGAIHGLRKENAEPASVLMLLRPGRDRAAYFRELVDRGDDLTESQMDELQSRHDNHFPEREVLERGSVSRPPGRPARLG